MNLKFEAMQILMRELSKNEFVAIYSMGECKEIPSQVTKVDLTNIIRILFKHLNWIKHDSPLKKNIEQRAIEKVSETTNENEPISCQKFGFEGRHIPNSGRVEENSAIIADPLNTYADILQNVEFDNGKEDDISVDTVNEPDKCTQDMKSSDLVMDSDDTGVPLEAKERKPLKKKSAVKKILSCTMCDYRSNDSSHMRRHEKIHSDEKPYKCSKCEKTFRNLSNLKRHESCHAGDKPFLCSRCDYRCNQLFDLKKHERIHVGDKPFNCSYCNYKCNSSSCLKAHERIHTGEKPFSCSDCDYKCITSSELRKHGRKHSSDKPFHCKQCDYKCKASNDLRKHERTHTEKQILLTMAKFC